MAFLTIKELIDIVVMSLVIGFIFKDFVRPKSWHPEALLKNITPGFHVGNLSDFWYAVLLVAPSIILHEFGHKLTAIAFGFAATFHAAYSWLAIGAILKMVMPGFIFFVPAYVSFSAMTTPLQSALIAFAGPAVNGLLWLGSWFAIKESRRLGIDNHETLRFIAMFRRINGFLFIFNLIPIPGFDGFHVLTGLAKMLF